LFPAASTAQIRNAYLLPPWRPVTAFVSVVLFVVNRATEQSGGGPAVLFMETMYPVTPTASDAADQVSVTVLLPAVAVGAEALSVGGVVSTITHVAVPLPV
jgi:hypothetical protein